MTDSRFKRAAVPAAAIILILAVLAASGGWPATATAEPLQQTPVGGKIEAANACYVRLPDLPAARYGGFGGYNPDTGVLTYAGGAEKRSAENTIAKYDLYAIKLDSDTATWRTINYSSNVGYTRETDKGCREMASVQLSATNWLSVFGKDGCDNGAFDTGSKKGGDIKELTIGDKASSSGVKWLANSGAQALVGDLVGGKGKLARAFAAYDTNRRRVVFGQGTFNDERDDTTQDEVYEANKVGSKWKLTELRPTGQVPSRRFGACAAYIGDTGTGVDGVIVLGGQQGGPSGSGAPTFNEVWWLDFSTNKNGQWAEITSRFGNQDAIGYRREGACAYDADTMNFYSWMGRANGGVPDGAKRSGGLWRVNLADLGDDTKTLTWERLAKDDLAGIDGRRLIPSVWDEANKRMFAIGGRNNLDEYADVWAIYPDVTGAACQGLDPYEPFRPQPTATTAPTTPPTAGPSPTPRSGATWEAPQPNYDSCDYIQNRVPAPVIAAALGSPPAEAQLCNPALPASPFNSWRDKLGLQNNSLPFHPLFNGLTWKCGCP